MNQQSLFEVKVKKIKITDDYPVQLQGTLINIKDKIFTALIQNHSALFYVDDTLNFHLRLDNTTENNLWKIVG